ncbi:FAD-dependent oxidoreductase [Halomonas sp. HL-93]|uniref:FAD-dependent oxidoreductase n=1 Tax=Halomonas sp. HL-93 TaxID=1666906 RepID=UPI0006D98B6B|nr:FAD-dependent oxidoreductase [Halomonas sp. HL-93]KPQ19366.1 MAG: pyridine nucleotide-disulfide oxidoreductase family protein [Halomonas sp. HL-93]SBR51317.1 sulfide:quinone oxidoreductase [Halomonas sp. HL-93]
MIQLLLIGAGHAHAFVLEAFARHPDARVAITVVSDSPMAAYSGSVPAWLAGECSLRDTQIDVAALCQRAGARFVSSPVVAIDSKTRHVSLANGETLHFDVASLNVGSTLALPTLHGDHLPHLLAMRPLSSLHHRWQALRNDIERLPQVGHQRVVSVGGGAAGCETLLSVLAQVRHQRPDIHWSGHVLSASQTLLPDAGRLPRWLTRRALARAGIQLHLQQRGASLVEGGVATTQGGFIAADIVLWATGAVGHDWLSNTQLPLDAQGFIRVEKTLEVAGQPGIFAAGDCAACDPPLPNAGVYAVRMGPHLADNLRRACHGESLTDWQPPARVLALIGTGDGRAIASRGALGVSGRWVWEWKKRIDARFLARFNPPFEDQ